MLPTLSPHETAPAVDLRVLTPSTDYLDPLPRALFIATAGILEIEAPAALPAVTVEAGTVLVLRASRVLPGTTATVVALY